LPDNAVFAALELNMKRSLLVCVLLVSACSVYAAEPAATVAPVPASPASEVAALQKQVADLKATLDSRLREIQQQLESISKFLGDRNASTFDSLDRRLRDIEDDIRDIKNDVRR